MDMLITIISFVATILLLVSIHELGHYMVARCCGVKVLTFSIGFGRKIASWQLKSGTELQLASIPLGGYVKMLDERDGPVSVAERAVAFNYKPLYQRVAIVLAGPVANFILAIVLFWLMFIIGIQGVIPKIGDVVEGSLAAESGMLPGDEILSVNHVRTQTWQQVLLELVAAQASSGPASLEIFNTEHQAKTVLLSPQVLTDAADDFLQQLGIKTAFQVVPAKIGEVLPNSAAERAGLLPKDIIIAINGKDIEGWFELVRHTKNNPQKQLTVTVVRNEQRLDIQVKPEIEQDSTGNVGIIGVLLDDDVWPADMLTTVNYSVLEALPQAIARTYEMTKITSAVLANMVRHADTSHVAGPIAIAKGAGESVSVGLEYYFGFLAMISISLAVINLLPIPLLDGGHLLFFMVEGLTGKPVSEQHQQMLATAGIIVLLSIFSVAMYNDLMGLLP